MFGDCRRDSSASTLVDWALPGSHAWMLFCSAPVSLADSDPKTPSITSQNTRTAHLALRPLATLMIARSSFIAVLPGNRRGHPGNR